MELSDNAKKIFENLYSFKGETIDQTFKRVADEYGNTEEEKELAYDLQKNNILRGNTPIYLNAGTKHKVFSACYVSGLEDSMESIYDVANVARKIFQYGAGIGIPIGNLRERDAYIFEGDSNNRPEGRSSGPVTFMKLYDAVGDTTKSGGRVRRAAILCAMPIYHPDILEFIKCKETDGRLSNMNISVSVTDDFMDKLENNEKFDLVSIYDGSIKETVDSNDLWLNLTEMAWKTADPGVLFLNTINEFNLLKKINKIECTNPCGEQVLHKNGCCNLCAINVSKFVLPNKKFDWKSLYETVYNVTRLMDNIIDKMDYPDERFKKMAQDYRQIGIGPMGLSDAMFMLDLKYNGADGRSFAGQIMETMTKAALDCSCDLASEKGQFKDYQKCKTDVEEIVSKWINNDERIMEKVRTHGLRNSSVTTCAPTGTTAISADASYGIEPCFGIVFTKNLIDGTTMNFVNPVFKERFQNEDWYTDDLIQKIVDNGGSLKNIRGIPKEVRDVFIVAHDIKWKDRIDIQAALQNYTTSAISSTINLPNDCSVKEVSEIYRYAHKKKLKGVTIYRDGCKMNQPVSFTDKKTGDVLDASRIQGLDSKRFFVETGNGKMRIHISQIKNKPVEVEISIGKGGQVIHALCEALGRVVSISLQNGVSVEDIYSTMLGINSDKPNWFRFENTDNKPSQILSIPDGLAQLLKRYYGKSEPFQMDEHICPSCGGSNVALVEGCMTCQDCGVGKCS